jgi:polyketide synthase PksN
VIYQELLQEAAESYLKSLFSEVCGSLSPEFDSFVPFGEIGIDSFYVLKIIRRLEADFGTLPKSLLFENFNINDLANYFIGKHEQILSEKCAKKVQGANLLNAHHAKVAKSPEKAKQAAAVGVDSTGRKAEPIRILEKEVYKQPEVRAIVQRLFESHKVEGCVSRGTRKIAPNLFIGSAKHGYFNYGRSKNTLLVYGYTGPRDYLPALTEEMYRYCEAHGLQLNMLADEEVPSVGRIFFSATPFGVLQRISNLKEFTLEGGAMRRLRYQVSKFEKSGACKTEEYRCGAHSETDRNIAGIIDRWCAERSVVNPLVHDVKAEILAGKLSSEHRLFLTYLDDVLQNVILITPMCAKERGYLMDLEFYPLDMPMGGLEFAIIQIIKVLVVEGCDVLSLGGTYGCKLNSSEIADPEIDKILDDLREQNIFNDAGNLQFKNKFRPENKSIFLCRPVGSGNPENVIDIIMMIADPEKMQTSDEENHNFKMAARVAAETPIDSSRSTESSHTRVERAAMEGNERSPILSESGFNPLNIPHGCVEFDLKTDSWAQLEMASIEAHLNHLHSQLQQPANVDDTLRSVFPFAHFVLTASGQEAEHIFFKAWPKKKVVLQNLLFPSTIFHEIDNGLTGTEVPDPAIFDLNSRGPYKGNMDWEALRVQVAQDPGAISFVCIELSNNAAGGQPVSMQHIKNVKAFLAKHSIPLVIDGTRVVENAQLLVEQETECAGKSIWTVVWEMLSCADAVIGSLTKDFCVKKGGIIATNDVRLFHRLQEFMHEEGTGIDLIDRKMIALSLQNRKQIESKVLRRMEGVRQIWQALNEHNVPIVQPAGGHCILIDVKQIPEFTDFKCPVASFLAWMYLNTGIRASAHSVGMQKHTSINDLVRLAVPVGLKRDQIDTMIGRLVHVFDKKENIPEIVMESSVPQPLGGTYANYKLIKYHNLSENIATGKNSTISAAGENIPTANLPTSNRTQASLKSVQSLPSSEIVAKDTSRETSIQGVANRRRSQTEDIAIVGMAGRYPKAKNVRELWENLVQGRDCIESIPADRHEQRFQHGSFETYRGGFIEDVDKFDSLFFNISPREAEMLDPQERLFLEVAWEAIEDAGYYPEILTKEDGSRNIGVFVGAVWAMYQMLGVEEKYAGNSIVPNSFLWSIANRVSYWMNFSGPSLTVDTACSSSLMAIYLACEAIHAGECSAAIVGGVNLDLHQAKLDINQNGGALSVDGVCRSFGKGANGYVAGEGVGALFLKPLSQAVQDGDNIYGVIKSVVVNHGGRTSGYTVPNPKAQTSLILSALEKANIDARSIGYIEAHGTGTELGDPIEIAGLSSAFEADHVENQACAIGSIKSNIGHLEAAAGVVSVSKVLLQMKHRQLVPSLHSAELNEFIDFRNSPFYVVQRLDEWKAKELDGVQLPLRAGISSFGAGGSNAHLILENYEPLEKGEEQPALPHPLIFPLSSKTEDQLRETAVRLKNFLGQNAVDLNNTAYTLQIGRRSFDHRLAIIATTKEELLEKLSRFISGQKSEGIASGHVKNAEGITRLLNRRQKENFIRVLLEDRDPHKLAQLWVEGLLGEWNGVQTHGSGRRVPLPTYAFADKRHWACKKLPARRVQQPAAGLHPMLDTNESTFDRQLFKKTFHERDFFIYDHHVANIPTLPGVAYLELARKAGESAAGMKVQKIKNVIWVSPIAVQNSTSKEVFVELKPSEATVRFEVFSNDEKGNKVLHSQGTLLYAARQGTAEEPEYIDLEAIRARCRKVIEGNDAYPLFKSFGLNLGPSFQVLQEVYKGKDEILGALKLPGFRESDLECMVLQPSLVDGSLQAGMAAQLGDKAEEMFVPYSIGEVEILHPLQSKCFSYVTEAKEVQKGKKENSRVLKTNVLIVDETGKVLVKIRESTGVPLREVHEKSQPGADVVGFSKLYYSYEWEKASLAVEKTEQHSSDFVVLFDTDETLRDLYQQRLRDAGANSDRVILVQPGDCFVDLGSRQAYQVNPQSKDDFTQLFERLIEKQCPVGNICFAWAAHHADLRDDENVLKGVTERGVYAFLFLCQSLIKQKLESKVQLLYLYAAKDGGVQAHNEAMTGFVNTLHLEHPKLLCKTLEIRQENPSTAQILDAVWEECRGIAQDATAVRYEAQERYIKKLKAFDLTAGSSSSQDASIREKGVYLITGGAGGLGLIFAQFLAKEYRAKLVLTGRSTLTPEREAKLEELRKSGSEVLYVPADISNYEDVRKLVHESTARFGEINGIIHAAGVIKDSLTRNKTREEMSAVCAPKIYGTLHLDEITKNQKLDFFVTFSSLAAVAGNAGQCDYSFANHFMDSFAAERELLRAKGARSGKTLSINWSLWANGGMKVDEQTELYFKKTLGISPLSTATGLEAFVRGLASKTSQFAILEGVQEKVELAWGLRKRKTVLTDSESDASPNQAATAAIGNVKEGDIRAWLQNELSQIVMAFLKLDASDVCPDKILLDLGFDSIGLTTFANAINEKYKIDVTPVLFFDYPSIGEIAKYLSVERESELRRFYRGSATTVTNITSTRATQQGKRPEGSEANQETTFAIGKGWDPSALDRKAIPQPTGRELSPELRFVNTPIAIVGISGVMPQSENLAEFWENLKNSKDMTSMIPPNRWRWEDYYGDPLKEVNKSNSKWGGFMREVDKFDPLFFGISPREAQAMDPQQRIFLESVWKAIEDSGQKVSDLSGTRTGLFVGVATNDYIDVMNKQQIALDGYTASGNSHSVLANRVSYLLNLRGPSAPIDTACSSSLVALHRAIESIHTGSCDMAIVGGVQVILSPAAYISFGIAGMLSSDGKGKAFDKNANGYVRGEGCGAIFLKPLSAAEADGNHIYAVIKATAENHGGRVTALTAPNSAAQAALLVEAYEKAHIDPATVGYIECHGIGSSLGDPIEVQALNKAFSELYKRRNKSLPQTPHCGLSSVKPNIGHLETAAGISSLLKALLAIKYKQIPATIHFEQINPYINLKATPFYIVDKLTPWEAPTDEDGVSVPRRAGVSSFGFGGANAHIVLEEYIPRERQSSPRESCPQVIVLSAKNADRLRAYVQSMYTYLQKEEPELCDFAYTLQVGRDEMPERLALVVSSTQELKDKLAEILKDDARPRDSYCNNIGNADSQSPAMEGVEGETPAQVVEQADLSKLAERWVVGATIDWQLLHKSDSPKRISIPTYPFAKERYWIPGAERKTAEMQKDSSPKLFDGNAFKAIDVTGQTIKSRIKDGLPSKGMSEEMSNDYIQKIIIQNLSAALRMDDDIIHNDAPFVAYGVDSIIGVSMVRAINETLKIELDPSKLFEYSTVSQLSQYICSHWEGQIKRHLIDLDCGHSTDGMPTEVEASPLQPSENIGTDPIAIIGMSGRFAEFESLDAFWQNLKEEKNRVKKESRWSALDRVASESTRQVHCNGGLIESIDQFDAAFFGISSQEATCMDPRQRLFLEECWMALEDAGYAGKGVHEKQCGVYVGCGKSNYGGLLTGDTPPHAFWGNLESVIPARIAYHLNLQGPAIAVDTDCSSSLVAIHLACQGLWSRETEMAVAGGVFVQARSEFREACTFPLDGTCYNSDARPTGFVPGEGGGVVVLKRLQNALEDGDYIHGVIAGSGINQDGSANGLIAAKSRAQERLERSVYDRFKINPETFQVVEAHGAGSGLGDSIEFGAITRAIREYTDKKQFCAIGTVTTSIGHAGGASGIAGVLKVLLALKHRQIPPCLHFRKDNPAIDFDSSPFYVNTHLKEWETEGKQRRRGAVSSFGFSGTNAHLVIEEAAPIERATVESPGNMIVLSARTAEQLKQQVANLLAFLKDRPNLAMIDVSFSLFVGRTHFSHRLSCIARDQKELIQLLDQWIETGAASQIYSSEIQESKVRKHRTLNKFGDYCIQECRNSPNAAIYLEYLATIAELFVQGYSLDFQSLFPPESRRIPLPTYPFARERHWIDTTIFAKPKSEASDRLARSPDDQSDATTSGLGIDVGQILENILGQKASLNGNYERVTF